MRCQVISLSQVYDQSYELAHKILKSGYRPEIIVAIARGGFIPARFLCDFLTVSDMTSIKIKHYGAAAVKERAAWVQYPLSADIKGRNVLVVDDVNDTGETLIAAANHIHDFQPAILKIAVLHEKQTTVMSADYYSLYVRKWRWIIYPWAVVEDVGTFLKKMEPYPISAADASVRLRREYGIRMSLRWIKKIMRLKISDEP
jgi:hypoxanthine phosphoribosyltransferase